MTKGGISTKKEEFFNKKLTEYQGLLDKIDTTGAEEFSKNPQSLKEISASVDKISKTKVTSGSSLESELSGIRKIEGEDFSVAKIAGEQQKLKIEANNLLSNDSFEKLLSALKKNNDVHLNLTSKDKSHIPSEEKHLTLNEIRNMEGKKFLNDELIIRSKERTPAITEAIELTSKLTTNKSFFKKATEYDKEVLNQILEKLNSKLTEKEHEEVDNLAKDIEDPKKKENLSENIKKLKNLLNTNKEKSKIPNTPTVKITIHKDTTGESAVRSAVTKTKRNHDEIIKILKNDNLPEDIKEALTTRKEKIFNVLKTQYTDLEDSKPVEETSDLKEIKPVVATKKKQTIVTQKIKDIKAQKDLKEQEKNTLELLTKEKSKVMEELRRPMTQEDRKATNATLQSIKEKIEELNSK